MKKNVIRSRPLKRTVLFFQIFFVSADARLKKWKCIKTSFVYGLNMRVWLSFFLCES